MRGYYLIGVYHPKTKSNIGTLWRSAFIMGAVGIFTIGKRYQRQASDTVKSWRHIPLFQYQSFADFKKYLPYNASLIGIEQDERSVNLDTFKHPERAVYMLRAEDNGLPKNIMDACHNIVQMDTSLCLNVAVAGSIVMYDRQTKNYRSPN